MVEKRNDYNAKFKRSVIRRADAIGNRKAAHEVGINESLVRRWRADRIRIFACESDRRAFRGPRAGRNPLLENELAQFIKDQRKNALPVTAKFIQNKAFEIATAQKINNFKACRSWVDRFMKRKGFSLRRRTTICQKLPADFEQKLLNFQQHVIHLRQKFQFKLSQIGNADETPIWLDMPRNTSVDVTGSRQVTIKTSGYEKQRVTVMLCITADGNKLPPYLIFKRKTIPKSKKGSKEAFPAGIHVRAQVKGWMTEELMKDWLQSVWGRRPGARNEPSLLTIDAFRGHLTDSVKDEIKNLKSEMVVIPGGMTSQLQPLDVCVNKPFKDFLRRHYEAWLRQDNHELTPAGKIKKASPFEVAKWVKLAWNSIDENVVKNSFVKCCISNSLDGSEDDAISWPTQNGKELAATNEESSESELEADFESESDESSDDE